MERMAAINAGDPFASLGVPKSASPQEIQQAYVMAAKAFHPDRLPADFAELRELAQKVFAAITDAHRTLSDPEKRRAAEKGGPSRAEEENKVQNALNAANNYAKAEHFLKRGDNAEALKFARLAADGDPERGEHHALLGWLESMLPDKTAVISGLKKVEHALKIDPESDRALYYRGAILKRLGKQEEAMRDFRRAATINPQNIEAQREIRLHGMRSEKPAAPGGLFSRWFGKK